jgi:hypothetical protein
MERSEVSDNNKTEQSRPSLGEEMNKLLESMDPQGLLNMAETEEATGSAGVDPTKGGDAHADAHDVSLTDNGSESGSSAGSSKEKTGNQSETMEVGSPKFRIVDIEPRPSAAQVPQFQPSSATESAAMNPVPVPVPDPTVSSSNSQPTLMASTATVFAVPLTPVSQENPFQNAGTITGKNIFSNPALNEYRYQIPNLLKKPDPNLRNRTSSENPPNIQKNPASAQTAQNDSLPLPTKKPDPVEPDAVPSKIYDAILANKKKKEKAGTIGGIASGQGPTECGSFFNKGDNRVLRSVYREDVNSLSVSSLSFNPVTWKCSSCPNNHSVLEANNKGGRCVIVLADQNFPAVLPSAENRCIAIIRLESGSLDELIDLFLKISRPVTVPEGTVVLFGSLTTLSKVGLQSFGSACINGSRRISGAIKGSVPTPFVPPPPPRRVQRS